MAATQNGLANGVNGDSHLDMPLMPNRFSHIEPAIDIPFYEGGAEQTVEINLVDLLDDPTELCTLLENENVEARYWMTIALAYAKQRKMDHGIEILRKALGALGSGKNVERLSILSCLCWMYLWKCREAPRVRIDAQSSSEVKTKDFYIHAATSTLNDASRISPSYPPLFLARGVLQLLRASLQPPSKSSSGQENSERIETLRQAAKSFEDALRVSGGKNMMAVLGKARVNFSLGKYADALQGYQTALERAPGLIDPDPRIGIGCCFWALGHKEDAKGAWERALELNPSSKVANILLGLFYLQSSSQYSTNDPKFKAAYKKAITQYTQRSFKLDDKYPLTCATFGGFFLSNKQLAHVERLSRRAIELTDVNAIASDGWYLLARKEHSENEVSKANEFYTKSDQARGGDERGYLPAKFGAAQVKVLMQDFDGAKFRLEKLIQQSKSIEAMTLLGTLYAEDVFSAQASNSREDKSTELKKAISLLEAVRAAWKDPKKHAEPDSAVLLNLARLYEVDHPEKSLQCLQQVEQMEIGDIPEEDYPEDVEDDAALKAALREFLPPQLLNNMGCFHYQSEKYPMARELFQTALNACVKVGDKDQAVDTDALVTTISYNLARTYEAEGMLDEAKKVYEGLLERHSDYTDANTRLTYIALRQDPQGEGPKAIQELYKTDPSNLDVRSLYGWFLSRAKRRTMNIAEDQEQRHYKHTLQQYDKHDRYSLTGMGNIYLTIAREMRKDTNEQEKEKRRKVYEKAVEFFDKALQLDPRNAYAAQGIGIAMVEDKKDFPTAVQIFTKVRETIKDPSVYLNLGHVYCELKQYSRAIENYEAALTKDRARDPQILACLGRVWLMRGRQEKSVQAIKTSLEYSRRALEAAPEHINFKFNIAFVQIQIAQLIYSLPEPQRTLADVEAAATGLDEAIDAFSAIAKSPNPPFPRSDLEQRASMGRNTMRKQLDRAIQSQREYEEKNAARLRDARMAREAEIRKREEEKRKAEEAAEEQKRKIAEERQRMQERDRELAEKRMEEERRREEAEMTTDEETGERVKRVKKKKGGKRKKKGGETDSEGEASDGGRRSRVRSGTSATPASEGGEKAPRKKKRRLEKKSKKQGKFKSSELVQESDSDDAAVTRQQENEALAAKLNESEVEQEDAAEESAPEETAANGPKTRPRKAARVIDDDDEDDYDAQDTSPAANGAKDGSPDEDVPMVDESVAAAGNENATVLGGDIEDE
ncbi:protein required for normal CLN1 and CLN2 G1 cyclin expression [Coniosporium apollinis]|uniref:Protein required for normal CLN1 and CLN2 G1 cyclin expression n=1 Tax=Coniosporium apollinis TaxID=61459 RepID=A0ABQ9NFU0_9PEZI|nr:protein required for normal CLN1 and CLN2 G1 cyclin expression [Coniosporium apollinis]